MVVIDLHLELRRGEDVAPFEGGATHGAHDLAPVMRRGYLLPGLRVNTHRTSGDGGEIRHLVHTFGTPHKTKLLSPNRLRPRQDLLNAVVAKGVGAGAQDAGLV